MYVYCVYTATSCMLKKIEFTHRKAQTLNKNSLKFSIGCLCHGPCLTIVYYAAFYMYIRLYSPSSHTYKAKVYAYTFILALNELIPE